MLIASCPLCSRILLKTGFKKSNPVLCHTLKTEAGLLLDIVSNGNINDNGLVLQWTWQAILHWDKTPQTPILSLWHQWAHWQWIWVLHKLYHILYIHIISYNHIFCFNRAKAEFVRPMFRGPNLCTLGKRPVVAWKERYSLKQNLVIHTISNRTLWLQTPYRKCMWPI